MADKDDWITDGKDYKVVEARSDDWVRTHAPKLLETLRSRGGNAHVRDAVVRRLFGLGDLEVTRALF